MGWREVPAEGLLEKVEANDYKQLILPGGG